MCNDMSVWQDCSDANKGNSVLTPLQVALDLDLTLVCIDQQFKVDHDFQMVGLPGVKGTLYGKKRAGVDDFLAWLGEHNVEVTVFTASVEAYAQSVVSHLDRDRTVIRHVLSRTWCSPSSQRGRFVKDLVVMGSDMRRTVLVDNDVSVFHPQPDNGILVADFVGQEDTELQRVQRLLNELLDARDVRSVLRRLDLRSQVNELMGHPPIHYDAWLVVLQCRMLFQSIMEDWVDFWESLSGVSLLVLLLTGCDLKTMYAMLAGRPSSLIRLGRTVFMRCTSALFSLLTLIS